MAEDRHTHREAMSWSESIRWALFRLLEAASEWRNPTPRGSLEPRPTGDNVPAVWIFVSTIGELNAIEPFIQRLRQARPGTKLVLLSDHDHYAHPYLTRYPDASFFYTRGASVDADVLCSRFPPELLVIGEIPCIPSDAPCRFSYAFIRAARRYGARIAIINGWLYGQQPGCRLDDWERRLFTESFLQSVDVACVQTQAVADRLIELGLDRDKAVVTGNMKFDNIKKGDWQVEHTRSPNLLNALIHGSRDVIVVGCLRNLAEQRLTIAAFGQVKKQRPDTLLVLVHRHPEVEENLIGLEHDLDGADLNHARRTVIGDTAPTATLDCLILDTMGELRDFYAAATITHVGADHNLLEPLGFGKPVTTVSEWHKGYPNYPIFELLKASGGIVVADNAEDLGACWSAWLDQASTHEEQRNKVDDLIACAAGAALTTFELAFPGHQKER